MAGPAFLDNVGLALVSDSTIPEMPALSSDSMNTAMLQGEKIRKIHLESDFATLYSSTPGKQFLGDSSPV